MKKPSDATMIALRKYYASYLNQLVQAVKGASRVELAELEMDAMLIGRGLNANEKQLIIDHVKRKASQSP